MATLTLDDVLRLVAQLSPTDQRQLRMRLETATDAARAAQQLRNQGAIAALDALEGDDADSDDSWWQPFASAIDTHRPSNRPLYPETEP